LAAPTLWAKAQQTEPCGRVSRGWASLSIRPGIVDITPPKAGSTIARTVAQLLRRQQYESKASALNGIGFVQKNSSKMRTEHRQ